MSTIVIAGKSYNLKYTLRALFVYEEITGVPFSSGKAINVYTLIYCILLVNNPDFMDFESFINAIDEDADISKNLSEWLNKENDKRSLFIENQEQEDSTGSEKKN